MSWDKVESDIASGPARTLKWVAIAAVALFLLFGGLRSIGLIGGKVVERQVLKHSFQYKEGMEQRAAILQANIAEVEAQLSATPGNKQLSSQLKVLQAQLRAITINE